MRMIIENIVIILDEHTITEEDVKAIQAINKFFDTLKEFVKVTTIKVKVPSETSP